MSNKQIERKLAEEIKTATPDIYPQLAAAVKNGENKEKSIMTTQTKPAKIKLSKIIALAACLALVIGISLFALNTYAVAGTITIDVNPSVEINVNAGGRVISVTALNDDAAAIIGQMDLKNTDLDVAVNAIIGAMVRNGYIDDTNNAILVTVNCSSESRRAQLKLQVENDINLSLSGDQIAPVVIKQNAASANSAVSEAKSAAAESGISVGKAMFIQKALARYPELGAYDLNGMTINEIVRLCKQLYIDVEDIADDDDEWVCSSQSIGNSGTGTGNGNHITGAEAKNAALKHAGLSVNEVTMLKVSYDRDDNPPHFDVEFCTADAEYEYKINAADASVISFEIDTADDDKYDDDIDDLIDDIIDGALDNASAATDTVHDAVSQAIEAVQSTVSAAISDFTNGNWHGNEGNGNGGNSAGYITGAQAKAIALNHAGFSADKVKYLEIDLDRAEGGEPANYDVEFTVGNIEYEYEINAVTGEIISHETDAND